MGDFTLYFELGIRHITALAAVDHILFLLALVSVYQFADMKRVIILVTAFTIGHSITLALATFDLVRVNSDWIEFLIPVTIFILAFFNMLKGKSAAKQRVGLSFILTVFFGFIHGLGFSNYLRSLLAQGDDVFWPLLGFNVGIEIAQIMIVLIILILAQLLFQAFRFKHRDWILVVCGICMGGALMLMKDTFFL
jgi:hypothetical protein